MSLTGELGSGSQLLVKPCASVHLPFLTYKLSTPTPGWGVARFNSQVFEVLELMTSAKSF